MMPMFGIYAKLRALQSQLVVEKLRQIRYAAEQMQVPGYLGGERVCLV